MVVAPAVPAGAVAQRVSGMGFALVLAVGPIDGVLMVNLFGATSACLVITRVWRHTDWRQCLLLVVPALVAVAPGAVVAARPGGPLLEVTIGGLVLVVVPVSLLVRRAERSTAPLPTGILAGAASGFLSATAGVGGPAPGSTPSSPGGSTASPPPHPRPAAPGGRGAGDRRLCGVPGVGRRTATAAGPARGAPRARTPPSSSRERGSAPPTSTSPSTRTSGAGRRGWWPSATSSPRPAGSS